MIIGGFVQEVVLKEWTGARRSQLLTGYGTVVTKDREISGRFINGYIYGRCTVKWNNGDFWDAEFHAGALNGEAIITFPDGFQYKGNYVNNR